MSTSPSVERPRRVRVLMDPGSAAWWRNNKNLPDAERAALTAPKLRLWLAFYDLLQSTTDYLTTVDIAAILDISHRRARRMIHLFDAAGLIKVDRRPGGGHEPFQVALKVKEVRK